jgi:hypothetical protein
MVMAAAASELSLTRMMGGSGISIGSSRASYNTQTMTPLEKVEAEIARYDHSLMRFSAREKRDGAVELVIWTREEIPGVHTYYAPIHPRDIEHPQFPWTFQKYLYDCLHDYLVELFVRTPQSRDA